MIVIRLLSCQFRLHQRITSLFFRTFKTNKVANKANSSPLLPTKSHWAARSPSNTKTANKKARVKQTAATFLKNKPRFHYSHKHKI